MREIFGDIRPAIDRCASAQQQHKHGHKCTHARLRFVLTTVIKAICASAVLSAARADTGLTLRMLGEWA